MSVDISVSITEDKVDIIATPTVNIVNVTNSASIDPGLYDLSEFTNTSPNPFVRTSGLSSYVPTSRTISTTSPLSGGGDLSVNRTLSISQANGTTNGFLSSSDWTMFNNKQNALGYTPVPETRTLTINGTTQDLSADRTFTISTGITIGTTAITSGTVGRVLFEGTGNVVQESANLFWDETNIRLGIGGTPVCKVQIITNNFTTTPPWSYDNTISQLAGATNQGLLATYSSTLGSFIGSVFPANAWLNLTYVANNHIFSIAGTEALRIASPTRNVLINTTTDAGFRLDVNGTARVSSTLTTANVRSSSDLAHDVGSVGIRYSAVYARLIGSGNSVFSIFNNTGTSITIPSTNNVLINTTTDAGFRLDVNGTARVKGDFVDLDSTNNERFKITDNASAGNSYTFLKRFDNTKDIFHVIFPSGTLTTSNVNWNFGIKGNTNNFSIASYDGGASATERFVITNTGNVLIGTSTNGASRLRVVGLPTSSAGLSAGDIWNDAGTLKIV